MERAAGEHRRCRIHGGGEGGGERRGERKEDRESVRGTVSQCWHMQLDPATPEALSINSVM